MKILEAQVTSNVDVSRTGLIQISCQDEPSITEAHYTTPYHRPYFNGGVFAIPAEKSMVLIAYNSSKKKAYYLSTIIDEEEIETSGAALDGKLFERPLVGLQNKLYEGFAPAVMKFKNDEDNGLTITDKNAKKYMVNETRLNSGGKILSLNSSPEIDSVLLDNGHGDFVKLTGMPQSAVGLPPDPKRSLQAKTFLSQEFVSDRGSVDLRVLEGKDVTIENDSTGFMSVNGFGGFRSGNINIFSKWKNIRLAAKGLLVPNGGQIILETALSKIWATNIGIALKAGILPQASLEMDANLGNIILKNTLSRLVMTNTGISLRSGTASIEINGLTGQITLVSPLPLNLVTPAINTTSQSINMAPGRVNIGSPASIVNILGLAVNIDGENGIFLNSGYALAASLGNFTPPSLSVPTSLGATPIVPTIDAEYPSGSKYPV